MAPGLTQPLTKMSTRNLPGGRGLPAHKADNLTAICEPTVQKMWKPRHLTSLSASMACYSNRFNFFSRVISGRIIGNDMKEENEV
jgi:hypothetical protein